MAERKRDNIIQRMKVVAQAIYASAISLYFRLETALHHCNKKQEGGCFINTRSFILFLTAHSQSFSSLDVVSREDLITDGTAVGAWIGAKDHTSTGSWRGGGDQVCSRELSKRSQENPLTSFWRRPSMIQRPLTRLQLFNA